VLEGRRARVATIEPAREKIRIVLYAEPDTLLPFRYDMLRPTRDGWKLSQTSTMEYNLALPAALFKPNFAPGTRIVRQGEGRETWERSLRQAKAVLSVGQQRIVVRDVAMNERGDLFVLFTAGRERDVDPGSAVMIDVDKPDLQMSGTEGEFLPVSMLHSRPTEGFYSDTDGPMAKKHMEGVRVDGEPLQWALWTRLEPLTPTQAARPQQLLLRARSSDGAFDHRMEIPLSPPATFILQSATVGLVPDYVRHFPNPMSEADLLNATDETRASALRYGLRRREGPMPDDLQKSLVLYRTIIERTEQQWRERGNLGVQPGKWLAVGELCFKLNRLDEAREALARAEEDNRIYGNAGDGTTRGIENLKQSLARP